MKISTATIAPALAAGTVAAVITATMATAPQAPPVRPGTNIGPLPTVASVDLTQYGGRWYELARLPVRFQNQKSVSTADYSLNPDGSVKVVNTAWLGDRVSARITGKATSVNAPENSRLRVRFGGLLRFIPTPKEGNYWVIDLKKDYSMAMVGTPDRRFLWLLARDKNAWSTAAAATMVERARDLGFDTSRLQVADWEKGMIRPSGA